MNICRTLHLQLRERTFKKKLLLYFWLHRTACGTSMKGLGSPTRDGTACPAVEVWGFNHRTAREVPRIYIFKVYMEYL